MTCRKIQALLENYIDDEVTKQQAELVEKHIKECKNCRAEHDDLVLLKELLANQKISPTDEEYWDETNRIIMARTIEAENDTVNIISVEQEKSRKKDAFYKSLISVAASLFILATSVLLGNSQDEQSFSKEFTVDKPVFSIVPKEKKEQSFEYVNDDSRIKQIGSRIILGAPGMLGRSGVLMELNNSEDN